MVSAIWSMVFPWAGIPLNALLKKVEMTSNAKFVEFISIDRPSEMLGQRSKILDWPYKEGLIYTQRLTPPIKI